MANLSEIKQAMQKGAKQYAVFKDAEEFIGGLEQLEEKETILKQKISDLHDQQEALIDGNKRIAGLLDDAKHQAEEIVQDAQDRASQLLAEASGVIFEHSKSLDQAKNTLTILDDKIKERQDQLSAVVFVIGQKNEELERLEKIKLAAKKALGV